MIRLPDNISICPPPSPLQVWQCSTLHRLRIAAQLPLQAGQFRPARLAALQVSSTTLYISEGVAQRCTCMTPLRFFCCFSFCGIQPLYSSAEREALVSWLLGLHARPP